MLAALDLHARQAVGARRFDQLGAMFKQVGLVWPPGLSRIAAWQHGMRPKAHYVFMPWNVPGSQRQAHTVGPLGRAPLRLPASGHAPGPAG